MSVTPPDVAKASFLKKKVAGVPVMYLAIGFVVILVAYAWKSKSAPAADSADTGTILDESTTPPVPVGTVVADNSGSTPTTGNSAIETNDDWLRKGVEFLGSQGVSGGTAQVALQSYLDGAQLTFQQGQMRDKVIREYGLPPYPTTAGGTAGDIARVQGPIPRVHVVKNAAEDSAGELAALYYGAGRSYVPIRDANNGKVKFAIGESVKIPAYPKPTAPAKPAVPSQPKPAAHPPVKTPVKPKRYYTVKRGDTLSGIAYHFYRNAASYTVIAKANHISNPNKITVGQKLLIP